MTDKMNEPKSKWGDAQMESIMGNLLRAGVLLSATVVLLGGVVYLMRYGGKPPHYRIFRGEPDDLRGVLPVIHFALAKHSRGWVQGGILLLIATPVARVVFSVYAFARERDWVYVRITLLVLAVLLYSLLGSKS